MTWLLRNIGAILFLAVTPIASQADEFKLVMFEEDGCYWCDLWMAEIAPIYPKTDEGKIAPLEVVDISDVLPASIKLKSTPVYTPTFVLLRDGTEVGKIEGYPGEDFFWWFLSELMKDFPEYQAQVGAS